MEETLSRLADGFAEIEAKLELVETLRCSPKTWALVKSAYTKKYDNPEEDWVWTAVWEAGKALPFGRVVLVGSEGTEVRVDLDV